MLLGKFRYIAGALLLAYLLFMILKSLKKKEEPPTDDSHTDVSITDDSHTDTNDSIVEVRNPPPILDESHALSSENKCNIDKCNKKIKTYIDLNLKFDDSTKKFNECNHCPTRYYTGKSKKGSKKGPKNWISYKNNDEAYKSLKVTVDDLSINNIMI